MPTKFKEFDIDNENEMKDLLDIFNNPQKQVLFTNGITYVKDREIYIKVLVFWKE